MNKLNAYDLITRQIIADLEAGVATWVKPWSGAGSAGAGMFRSMNAETRRPYSGINSLILMSALMANGWEKPLFLTFNQAKKLGGSVLKGSKGTQVVFLGTHTKEDEHGDEKTYRFLKTFTVFNVAQIGGLPERVTRWEKPVPMTMDQFDDYVAATGVHLQHSGDRACYVPSLDVVLMPGKDAFKGLEFYQGTLLHEMTHWTGHRSRLDRDFSGRFGSESYAFEELVAELGSAFLCADLGVAGRLQHSEYIGSWIKVLKANPRALMQAASLAEKAVSFIHAAASAGEEEEALAA